MIECVSGRFEPVAISLPHLVNLYCLLPIYTHRSGFTRYETEVG